MKTYRAFVVSIASCAFAATSFAAGYLKIGDIKGESTDSEHKDWIELQSFSFGTSQSGMRESPTKQSSDRDAATGQASGKRDAASGQATGKRDAASGLPTGKRQHEPIIFVKRIDKASPILAKAMADGTVFKTVEIGDEYIKYELQNVMVSSIQASGGGDVPMEEISFNYDKIEMKKLRESPTRAIDKATSGKPTRAPN